MSKQRSPWVYVGIGCTVVVVLGVLGVLGGGLYLYQTMQQTVADMKDPVARDEKVRELLGAESLPPGYHAMMALKIPFALEMAMLSDKEADDEGNIEDFDTYGFLYFRMPTKTDSELKDYFEGKSSDASVFKRKKLNLDIDSDEVLGRGLLSVNGQNLLYISQLGSMNSDHGRNSGIQTLILIECEQDRRMRLAIWFGPLPEKNEIGDWLLEGTQADESELETFMSYFTICKETKKN